MIKSICKHCSNFEPDPSTNYCLCWPYPDPMEYSCRCVDFDPSVDVRDLVDCPDCVYALDGIWCTRGLSDAQQSDCLNFLPCLA